ncbi:MAG: HIT domain-containing protein [Phycisphaerales bacterium]|nr:HIT domain-containing protein [Phycisphaerales bacterium]
MSTQREPEIGVRQLHAPWRDSYMQMLSTQRPSDPAKQVAPKPKSTSCFLQQYWLSPNDDVANHVIVRTGLPGQPTGGMIMLNAYPYANGHLLVALGAGRGRLLEYDAAQRAEFWSLVDLAVDLCERTLQCQGVNVGINQGMAAGAGVPEHLHAHVVPRWHGDTNFITTVGQVRIIPGALDKMAERYRAIWDEVRKEANVS